MLEQTVRDYYQFVFVAPVVRRIAHQALPLHITVLAVVFGLLFVPCIVTGHVIVAILFLLLSGYCDTLDGSLARYQDNATSMGCVLDIMADRLVEFGVILGLYLVDPIHRGLLSLLMLGSVLLCVSSFLMVAIFTPNESAKSCHYSPGLMERAEAFLFFYRDGPDAIMVYAISRIIYFSCVVYSGLKTHAIFKSSSSRRDTQRILKFGDRHPLT